MPSRFDSCGLDQAVREQVQAQVDVVRVGRRRRRGRSRTCDDVDAARRGRGACPWRRPASARSCGAGCAGRRRRRAAARDTRCRARVAVGGDGREAVCPTRVRWLTRPTVPTLTGGQPVRLGAVLRPRPDATPRRPDRGARRRRRRSPATRTRWPTRSRPRCARAATLARRARRQRRARPHRPRPRRSGSCSPATSTPCRSPTTCPRRRRRRPCCTAAAPSDMKAGVAVMLRVAHLVGTRRARARASTSPWSSTTARRSRRRATAWAGSPATRRELAGRRPRHPARADRRRGRGRLPGHAARRGACHGRARAQRAVLARRQRDPRGRRRCSTRWRPTRPREVDVDGLRLPRGPNAVAITRRRRRQRRPGRVHGHGQLPLRARPRRAPRRSRTCARCSTGYERRADRLRAGARRPGSTRAGRGRVRRGGRRRRRGPSSAGPTSPASPRSASRR